MRSFAARPFACVIVAICVAGLTLVVIMPGAQADAKPCDKPTNGQKVGWQRGHGPKPPDPETARVRADSLGGPTGRGLGLG